MKRVFLLFAILAPNAGCLLADRPESPQQVAVAFLRALQNQDMEKAKGLATTESAPALELGREILLRAEDPDLRNAFEGRWADAACEGTDAYQTCTVCCAETGMNAALVLVREKGAWKVSLDKSGAEAIEQGIQMLAGSFQDVDTTGWGSELDRVIDSLEHTADTSFSPSR